MKQSPSVKVFCYGSNMSSKRLTAPGRCPSAKYLCIAKIDGYKLLFNKISKDNSSKANIILTHCATDSVWGVIFQIPLTEKSSLDAAEGKGFGYEEQSISVLDTTGQIIESLCYLAIDKIYLNDSLEPYDWYLKHCVIGAKENYFLIN